MEFIESYGSNWKSSTKLHQHIYWKRVFSKVKTPMSPLTFRHLSHHFTSLNIPSQSWAFPTDETYRTNAFCYAFCSSNLFPDKKLLNDPKRQTSDGATSDQHCVVAAEPPTASLYQRQTSDDATSDQHCVVAAEPLTASLYQRQTSDGARSDQHCVVAAEPPTASLHHAEASFQCFCTMPSCNFATVSQYLKLLLTADCWLLVLVGGLHKPRTFFMQMSNFFCSGWIRMFPSHEVSFLLWSELINAWFTKLSAHNSPQSW
jgi:hypothetical protein